MMISKLLFHMKAIEKSLCIILILLNIVKPVQIYGQEEKSRKENSISLWVSYNLAHSPLSTSNFFSKYYSSSNVIQGMASFWIDPVNITSEDKSFKGISLSFKKLQFGINNSTVQQDFGSNGVIAINGKLSVFIANISFDLFVPILKNTYFTFQIGPSYFSGKYFLDVSTNAIKVVFPMSSKYNALGGSFFFGLEYTPIRYIGFFINGGYEAALLPGDWVKGDKDLGFWVTNMGVRISYYF